jgi:hypothetical protein
MTNSFQWKSGREKPNKSLSPGRATVAQWKSERRLTKDPGFAPQPGQIKKNVTVTAIAIREH